MEKNKVLIYEDVSKDVVMLEFLCKQHEMVSFSCSEPKKASEIVQNENIQTAFVNYSLERLSIPKDVAVIALGAPKSEASMRIIGYDPVCFIPKPLTFATISLGLIEATKTLPESKSHVSNLVNIYILLAELEEKITAVMKSETHNVNLTESMKNHCEEHCPFAKTGSEVKEDPEGQYEALNYFTSRGALFCKRKNVCELWDFHKWLEEEHPHLIKEEPNDLLYCDSFAKDKLNFRNALESLTAAYNEKINTFYDLKFEYDTKRCDAKKEGLDYQKGDHVFSKTQEMLACQNCSYCSEHDCPLDKFFELFKHKVL